MAENWFARKLAERQGQQPHAPGPPMGPRSPQQLQRATQAPVAYDTQGNGGEPPLWIMGNDGKPMLNALAWKGNRKNGYMKEPNIVCPECGGTNFFTRRGGIMTQNGRAPAAEHCYDCGYNPLFTPFGGGTSLVITETEA